MSAWYLQLQKIWAPFWPLRAPIHTQHALTQMHTHITKKINFRTISFESFYEKHNFISSRTKSNRTKLPWELNSPMQNHFLKTTFHTESDFPALLFHCGLVLACRLLWSSEIGSRFWSKSQILNLCRWCKLEILFLFVSSQQRSTKVMSGSD